jgi:tetratricopeptide (TPR) repeat protein
VVSAPKIALFVALGLFVPAGGGAFADAPAKKQKAKHKKKKKRAPSRRAARAQAAFEKAKALFEADEFEGALVYFREAYDYSNRRPSTIAALAQCERILKRYDDALLHFREYLATGLPEAEAIKVRETIQVVEELKAIEEREAADARLAETASETATLAAPPPGPEPVLIATAPPPIEEKSLIESPVFWIILGGVLVAGGAAAGIAAAYTTERAPYDGTTKTVGQPVFQ